MSGSGRQDTEESRGSRPLAALLASSPIGLALVAPNGGILEANPALARMLGREADALTAATLRELTHPDDVDVDLTLIGEMLAGRRECYQLTKRYLRPDGSVVWGNQSVSCVRDDQGCVEYVICQIVDVSEQIERYRQAGELEARFRMLAENSSDFVVLTDPKGIVEWVSDSVEGMLGWPPASVIGRASQDFVDPAGIPQMQRLNEQAGEGHAARGRIRIRSAEGGFRWFVHTMRTVHDESGTLVAHVMGFHDIQPEVEAEDRLAESERRYRLLAENASDIVFLGTPDRVLTWVSPSVADVLGWDPSEMVGHRIEVFLHPDDLATVMQASGAVNELGRGEYEARWRRPDGTYRWLAIVAHATTDESGVVTGRVASGRDVTAERLVRSAAIESEQRFRLAMESAPMGMAVVDLDRRFVEVNAALCRMVGRDETWMLAHRVPDIIDPDDNSLDLQVRAEVLSGRARAATRIKRLVVADGSRIIVQHSVGLLRDEQGLPSSYVSVFIDVTEAHEAHERLAFLASHDPLTHVDNRVELQSQLRRALARKPRTGLEVAVLYLDVDELKTVNDSLGHAAGDRLIVQVAEAIRCHIRQEDHVARIGGDEFVAALVGLHGTADAEAIAAKIHRELAEPFDIGGTLVVPSVSIGIAVAEVDEDIERLLARADRAMYAAKQAGRGRTVVYDEMRLDE